MPPGCAAPAACSIIGVVDPLPLLRTLRAQSSTVRGQLVGAALIAVPALVNPIPLDGAAHATLQVLAIAVGVAGAVVVFGGLFQWVFLPARTATAPVPAPAPEPVPGPAPDQVADGDPGARDYAAREAARE